MSTCARCGLLEGCGVGLCEADCDEPHNPGEGTIACRDRELANLRSLLRSVTISLEQAAGYCEGGHAQEAERVIHSVLERLS